MKEFVDTYFTYLAGDNPKKVQDKERVFKSLSYKENFKKFIKIDGTVKDFYPNGYYKTVDPAALGLDSYNDIEYVARLRSFLHYAFCKLRAWRFNNMCKYHTRSANNALAYKAMMNFFDLGENTPDLSYCILEIDNNKQIFGTLMSDATGEYAYTYSKGYIRDHLSPDLQRQLINLSIVDYLCVMRDHTKWNYTIKLNTKGEFYNLCVFDTLEEGAFPMDKFLEIKGEHGESSIINGGVFFRPFIDFDIVNIILNIRKKILNNILQPYLNHRQIEMCWQRCVYLKHAIINKTERIENFILKKEEWNQETIKEELSGKYGITGLVHLLKY